MKRNITLYLLSLFVIAVLPGCASVGSSTAGFQVHPQSVGEQLKIYAQRSALGQNVPDGFSAILMEYCYSETPPDAQGTFKPQHAFLTPIQIKTGATPDQVIVLGSKADKAGYYAVQLQDPENTFNMNEWLIIQVK